MGAVALFQGSIALLLLTDQTTRFIEFTAGAVEVLPMPTRKHQAISRFAEEGVI